MWRGFRVSPTRSTNGGPLRQLDRNTGHSHLRRGGEARDLGADAAEAGKAASMVLPPQPHQWSEVFLRFRTESSPRGSAQSARRETEDPGRGCGERHDVFGDFRRGELLAVGQENVTLSQASVAR